MNLSNFPQEYDSFIEHYSISNSDLPLVSRFQELKLKESKTQAEINELNSLLINPQLRPKLFLEDDLNKLQDSMTNIQKFTKEAILNYYKYMGNYNNSTTYTIFNSVTYTDGSVYMLYNTSSYNAGVNPTVTSNWLKISAKGDKGIKWKGGYSSSTNYVIDDVVRYDGTMYISLQSSVNRQPDINPSYWEIATMRGDRGFDGLNLIFKDVYSGIATYSKNDMVQYNGSLYACISDSAISGVLPTNTVSWRLALAKGETALLSMLTNNVVLTTTSTNVRVLGGTLTAFNKTIDNLLVFKNSVLLENDKDYKIATDGISVDKLDGGTWYKDDTFNFIAFKNTMTVINFNDGQLIQDKSITINKLSDDLQDKINAFSSSITTFSGTVEPTEYKAKDIWFKIL